MTTSKTGYRLLTALLFTLALSFTAHADTLSFANKTLGASADLSNGTGTRIQTVGQTSFFDIEIMGKPILWSQKKTLNGWITSFGDSTVDYNGSTYFVPSYATGNSLTTSSNEFGLRNVKNGKIVLPFTVVAGFNVSPNLRASVGKDGIATISLNTQNQITGITSTFGGGISTARMSAELSPTATPEPVTMILLGTGLFGTMAEVRRRRRGQAAIETDTTV